MINTLKSQLWEGHCRLRAAGKTLIKATLAFGTQYAAACSLNSSRTLVVNAAINFQMKRVVDTVYRLA
jgi:hypothetical protein